VALRYDTIIERLILAGERVSEIQTDHGPIEADAFVMAAGAESVFLAETIGLRLPIYPVKGFSITAPFTNPAAAPRAGIVDEDRLVAMSTLGNRLRAASSAVFSGFNYGHRPKDFHMILETARELFSDAVDFDAAEYWAGLRPMTPTSVPILGRSRFSNLFLNVGHGHVGWSMSCGAGKFVADGIGGRKAEISGEGLIAD
jgi:D-amino-acid dehydrogenase